MDSKTERRINLAKRKARAGVVALCPYISILATCSYLESRPGIRGLTYRLTEASHNVK